MELIYGEILKCCYEFIIKTQSETFEGNVRIIRKDKKLSIKLF
jgi:hypothetical protein